MKQKSAVYKLQNVQGPENLCSKEIHFTFQ